MILWRLEYAKHLDGSLLGAGARFHGGRWNRKGTGVVYLSSHLGLAALEKFVHVQVTVKHDALYAVSVEVPDEHVATAQYPHPLPRTWRSPQPDVDTMKWGTNWAASKQTLAAMVPSALLPLDVFEQSSEFNLMLDPDHADMKQVRIVAQLPFSFDPRVWKG